MNKKEMIESYREDLVSWRRDFHRHPELGFEEFRTSKKIIEILSDYDVEILHGFCETTVAVIVKGEEDGPTIGLRADMDALPMDDLKDTEYKSQNAGVCHACGHDVHVTIAMGVLRYYAEHKGELKGTLKVIFQPAEEGPAPGGASKVVATDVIDDIDIMLCLHTNPDHSVGTLLLRRGEMLASADNFNVTIKGKGGHGAYPHQTKDSLATAIEIYERFQLLITREVDPVKATVLSVCNFSAGSPRATNVIPEMTTFGGTIRSFDNEVRTYLINRMKDTIKSICELNGCTAEMTFAPVSIALKNDDGLIDVLAETGAELLGEDHVKFMDVPEMGYDDFAYYGEKTRAVYFYWGTTNENDLGKFTFHHPRFDVDEECLCLGVELLVNAVKKCAEL